MTQPKEKWFTRPQGICGIVLVFFFLIGMISIISSVGKPVATKPTSSTQKTETKQVSTPSTPKVGESIQVGEIKWVVVSVNKESEIGDNQYLRKKANGQFLILELSAEMTGKKSGTIDSTQLEITDSQNRTYTHSIEGESALTSYGSGKEQLFLQQVNPNVPIKGYAVFDIASDSQGLKLKVKDLAFFSSKSGLVDLGI